MIRKKATRALVLRLAHSVLLCTTGLPRRSGAALSESDRSALAAALDYQGKERKRVVDPVVAVFLQQVLVQHTCTAQEAELVEFLGSGAGLVTALCDPDSAAAILAVLRPDSVSRPSQVQWIAISSGAPLLTPLINQLLLRWDPVLAAVLLHLVRAAQRAFESPMAPDLSGSREPATAGNLYFPSLTYVRQLRRYKKVRWRISSGLLPHLTRMNRTGGTDAQRITRPCPIVPEVSLPFTVRMAFAMDSPFLARESRLACRSK
jgi:hypothetical protein